MRDLAGLSLFLLIEGRNKYFTILFSYWFSIITIKKAIVSNEKKSKVAIHSFLLIGGVLAVGRRDYIWGVKVHRTKANKEKNVLVQKSRNTPNMEI